jgi:hypothetical protein
MNGVASLMLLWPDRVALNSRSHLVQVNGMRWAVYEAVPLLCVL